MKLFDFEVKPQETWIPRGAQKKVSCWTQNTRFRAKRIRMVDLGLMAEYPHARVWGSLVFMTILSPIAISNYGMSDIPHPAHIPGMYARLSSSTAIALQIKGGSRRARVGKSHRMIIEAIDWHQMIALASFEWSLLKPASPKSLAQPYGFTKRMNRWVMDRIIILWILTGYECPRQRLHWILGRYNEFPPDGTGPRIQFWSLRPVRLSSNSSPWFPCTCGCVHFSRCTRRCGMVK